MLSSSANKHVVQICRSSQSAAVQTVQVERQTPPFNGIERSLSRAVVIKTKSLPYLRYHVSNSVIFKVENNSFELTRIFKESFIDQR